ncbi:hypothetical protein K439DRAFT_1630609, partial [Ramaria rubella]
MVRIAFRTRAYTSRRTIERRAHAVRIMSLSLSSVVVSAPVSVRPGASCNWFLSLSLRFADPRANFRTVQLLRNRRSGI